jgi:tetraacyldisaccharide 4'-kinase
VRGIERYLAEVWYGDRPGHWLRPLGALYGGAMRLRRQLYRRGLRNTYRAPCPVVVVGNLTVGGTGKTPLVIELVRRLAVAGRRPGIISRGYGGTVTAASAALVRPDSDPVAVGDEPLLMARRTGVPVAVCPNRRLAIECLLAQDVQVVVADDGLQHLALQRDADIVVIDGARGLGNGRCLPAGPLRGPVEPARAADLTIVNGAANAAQYSMTLRANQARRLVDGESVALESFAGKTVHAVAGIGNPARFFALLRDVGIEVVEHPFADHATLTQADVTFDDTLAVLMTEKDSVRFARSPHDRCYDVPVDAELNAAAAGALDRLLDRL